MPAVVGFGFFLKTEQDNKQVEPVSLGVGYFTGLLWDFLFALWCWEAQELKYCSRETPKSCGGEMNLQSDKFTGPAAGSESCRAAIAGSTPDSTPLPSAAPQTCLRSSTDER